MRDIASGHCNRPCCSNDNPRVPLQLICMVGMSPLAVTHWMTLLSSPIRMSACLQRLPGQERTTLWFCHRCAAETAVPAAAVVTVCCAVLLSAVAVATDNCHRERPHDSSAFGICKAFEHIIKSHGDIIMLILSVMMMPLHDWTAHPRLKNRRSVWHHGYP